MSDSPQTTTRTPSPVRRLAALDGIRAIGSVLVVSYHAGYAWAEGGVLAVSMFFTLSGFLITRLLVREHQRTQRISLRSFYARRVQRLLPTALTVFLGVAVFWAVFPGQGRSMSFSSFFWAVFYGTNLHLLFQSNSYMDLFADASPLQHTWSLSLEEQIYVVIPLLLLLVVRSPRVRRYTAAILTAAAAASFLAAWGWAGVSNDRAYYATEARAGEFLLGAALAAFWVTSPRVPRIIAFLRSGIGNVVGIIVLVIDFSLWGTATIQAHNLFRGLIVVNGVLVCVLIAIACADAPDAEGGRRPVVSVFLGWGPFAAMGQRAYAIYLVHWPTILFIDEFRGRTAGLQLFAVRVVVTLALAEVLFQCIERPVMEHRRFTGPNLYRACALLAAGGLVVASFVATPAAKVFIDVDALALQNASLAELPQVAATDPIRSDLDPNLPSRVLVVGDSQSWFVGNGLRDLWGDERGMLAKSLPGVGCGVSELGPIRYLGDEFDTGRPGCLEWQQFIPKTLDRFLPPVVVVIGGFADLCDRRIDGNGDGIPEDAWQHIGQPGYDRWLVEQMNQFADLLSSRGARVLWLTSPEVNPPNPPGIDAYPEEDPARMARYNELIMQVADARDDVDTADLARMVAERPEGSFNPDFRPDGSHMVLDAAPDVLAFIVDALESTMRNVD